MRLDVTLTGSKQALRLKRPDPNTFFTSLGGSDVAQHPAAPGQSLRTPRQSPWTARLGWVFLLLVVVVWYASAPSIPNTTSTTSTITIQGLKGSPNGSSPSLNPKPEMHGSHPMSL